ncbi:MAG TPA: MEDS domain-containing protein [Oligoflexus sp.]|uniref:MEDS domain-containing protein n=1 Tax=Oligoflexus sp. TaxID=1971216 RepID=UPI002D466AA7|nr:MEDS domain-containing protein [Oligoflexus sp.]HYX32555.1 MEDS domain-containing protein [Oligoflexus sp.]
MELVESGIRALGDIAWGSHFCNFYQDQMDLIETLVPFFKAGLDNHERCLWVTSEPLLAQDARIMLRKAVPNLPELEERGQIEIINHSDWYLRAGKNDVQQTLQQWVHRHYQALEQGYNGLRLTGNTYWLEKDDWSAFTEYEAKVNETFFQHRIIGLCSYCMGRAGSREVFDVIRNHDFALLRQGGEWELVESVSSRTVNGNMQKLNRELRSSLKEATLAAESASRLKTEFLANMSHEIRTPLAAILGFTDLLAEDDLPEHDKKEFIAVIQRNGTALTRLVDDILDISKVEADRLQIEKLAFSPMELVDEMIAIFTPATRAKSITIQAAYPSNLPATITSDPTRLRQILVNLIGNAVKFTSSGEISVQVEVLRGPPPGILFRVSDSGIGIDKVHQQDLFQPFNQADGSMTRKFGGTGLGLYLSRRLAQALAGDVVLEHTELGKGSSFVATIGIEAQELRGESVASFTPIPSCESKAQHREELHQFKMG